MGTARKFLFMSDDGFHEEQDPSDTLTLGGLSMSGSITMSGNRITGLGNGTDANDAINKSQLDALASGIHWKDPVEVMDLISDADQGGSPPVTPAEGNAYVVNNWGSGYTDGDIVEYNGTAWVVILSAVGGEPPTGTRVIVTDGTAAGAFVGKEDNFATYNATTDTWTFVAPAEGDASLVVGEGGVNENNGYTYDNTAWVQFTGAGQLNAGDGLTKDGNTLNVGAGNGIAVAADSVAVNLAGTPGLEFGTGGDAGKLLVKVDGSHGIIITSTGIEIEIDDDPNTLDVDADGLKVVGLPGAFLIAGTAVSTGVTAPNLDNLVNGSNADALHAHSHTSLSDVGADDHHNQTHSFLGTDHTLGTLTVGDILTATSTSGASWAAPAVPPYANAVEGAKVALETVVAGNPVYWSGTANKFGKADAGTLAKSYVFGVAKEGISADGTGEVVSYGPAAGVLSSATPGDNYYLASGGGLTTTRPVGTGNRVILIGWAINADDLWVQPIDYGRAA